MQRLRLRLILSLFYHGVTCFAAGPAPDCSARAEVKGRFLSAAQQNATHEDIFGNDAQSDLVAQLASRAFADFLNAPKGLKRKIAALHQLHIEHIRDTGLAEMKPVLRRLGSAEVGSLTFKPMLLSSDPLPQNIVRLRYRVYILGKHSHWIPYRAVGALEYIVLQGEDFRSIELEAALDPRDFSVAVNHSLRRDEEAPAERPWEVSVFAGEDTEIKERLRLERQAKAYVSEQMLSLAGKNLEFEVVRLANRGVLGPGDAAAESAHYYERDYRAVGDETLLLTQVFVREREATGTVKTLAVLGLCTQFISLQKKRGDAASVLWRSAVTEVWNQVAVSPRISNPAQP